MDNQLIYTDTFLKDLENICEYIAEDNAGEAAKFAKSVFEVTRNLSEFPLSGTLPKNKFRQLKDYRMLIHGNYIIYYQPDACVKKVYLHRVVHGARYNF